MKQLDVDVSPPANIINLALSRYLCVLRALLLGGICLQITGLGRLIGLMTLIGIINNTLINQINAN